MPVARREKFGHGHGKHAGKLEEFRISHPANPALDAGDDAARHIPADSLAGGGEIGLRPASFRPKTDDLRSNDVARVFHEDQQAYEPRICILSGIPDNVWNSTQPRFAFMDTEKRLKVLVIHHDTGASCAYTAIARSAGWEAFSCEDIGDVAGSIRDNDVDVLIFEFSAESGFEALRKVHHVDASLPVILITAHPVDHEVMMSLGVKVILPKPPDVEQLRETLAALTVTTAPSSDFKILFQFLERCDAVQRVKEDRLSREE